MLICMITVISAIILRKHVTKEEDKNIKILLAIGIPMLPHYLSNCKCSPYTMLCHGSLINTTTVFNTSYAKPILSPKL